MVAIASAIILLCSSSKWTPSIGLEVTNFPASKKELKSLKAGELVYLSGRIITGRDQAHKRLTETLKTGKKLPVLLKGQAIYYVGPTPARPGKPIGSAGPTTSYRMDAYAPKMMELGMKGLRQDGLLKVKERMTTAEEVLRAALMTADCPAGSAAGASNWILLTS